MHIPGISDVVNIKVNVKRYTLKDLTYKICNECNLRPPRRLKNLEADKCYMKADEDTILHDIEYFRAGGASVEIKDGRYCAEDELSIYVKYISQKEGEKSKKEVTKTFYFNKSDNVEKCKQFICMEFGIEDPEEMKKLTLF